MNENVHSKESKLAASWLKKEKVYSIEPPMLFILEKQGRVQGKDFLS